MALDSESIRMKKKLGHYWFGFSLLENLSFVVLNQRAGYYLWLYINTSWSLANLHSDWSWGAPCHWQGGIYQSQSPAAAFARIDCLCFSKNRERCDEENRRVNGDAKEKDVHIWKLSEDRRGIDTVRCWGKSCKTRRIAVERKCFERRMKR